MRSRFVLFIAVLFPMCASQPVAAGQPSAVSKVNVAGLGKSQTSESLALLRGHGVVKTGDIITVPDAAGSYRLLVLSITKDGIELKRLDLEKGPEKSLDPISKIRSTLRDPFWPVGYSKLVHELDTSPLIGE